MCGARGRLAHRSDPPPDYYRCCRSGEGLRLEHGCVVFSSGLSILIHSTRKFITSEVMTSFSSGFDSAIIMVVATRALSLTVF